MPSHYSVPPGTPPWMQNFLMRHGLGRGPAIRSGMQAPKLKDRFKNELRQGQYVPGLSQPMQLGRGGMVPYYGEAPYNRLSDDPFHPQGMANFRNYTWGNLLDQLRAQGLDRDPTGLGAMTRMLGGFMGSEEEWRYWLQQSKPFLYGMLKNAPSYRYLSDFANIDKSMQAYGAGAGQLAQGAAQAVRTGRNQLASAGLGRSALQAALARQAQQQLASQQADLFTRLYQQSWMNKAQFAKQAFDMDTLITRLMLSNLAPRLMPKRQSGVGGAAQLGLGVGKILGSIAAAALGAPSAGAAAGSAAGGATTAVV